MELIKLHEELGKDTTPMDGPTAFTGTFASMLPCN